MKNKIENLSIFLLFGLSLFIMVKMLMFVISFFSSMDVQSSTVALGG